MPLYAFVKQSARAILIFKFKQYIWCYIPRRIL